MEFFHLAWKNLWRNRRRTLITLAAMAFSVMLVQTFHNLAFGVYARMVDSGVRAGSGHIAVYRGDYVESRDEKLSFAPKDLPGKIARLDGVSGVLPRVYLPGLAQSSRESRGILLTGVDPQQERAINPFLKNLPGEEMVRPEHPEDAVVGSRLVRELKIEKGSKFVITVQSRSGDLVSELFRVRGIVHTGIREVDGSLVMVGRDRAAAMGGIPGEVHELAVVLKDAGKVESALPAVGRLLRNRPGLRAVPWEKAMPNLANAIRLDYSSQKFPRFHPQAQSGNRGDLLTAERIDLGD
ncbi:MAG: ABC transporter permease, partial [Desulfuromonadales bacterium]